MINGGQRWRRPGGRRTGGLEAGGFVGDGREDHIGSQRLCGFADLRETIGRTAGPEAGGFAASWETNGVSEDRRLCGFAREDRKDQRIGDQFQAAWRHQKRLRRRSGTAAAATRGGGKAPGRSVNVGVSVRKRQSDCGIVIIPLDSPSFLFLGFSLFSLSISLCHCPKETIQPRGF